MRKLAKTALSALLVAMLGGCGFVPENVPVHDPRIAPLWTAARAFDRTKYGFSPLPHTGSVGWEHRSRSNYDAMLHIGGKTERTISFQKLPNGYRWIGDQEDFKGPNVYRTPDGDQREEIVLNYDVVPISGFPLNTLAILYLGDDPRYEGKTLALQDVRPILKQWGY
jgi:hypothetical protein